MSTKASTNAPAEAGSAPARAAVANGRHPTPAERVATGRQARLDTPRETLEEIGSVPDRDPIAVLEAQAVSRVQELVPIRYGRMLASPFSFYRGAAAIMAQDLAATPSTGLRTQLVGDAHVANFGGFASPERSLIFDMNDFDETLPGPFEWDVKRLVASIEVAGRVRGFSKAERRDSMLGATRGYREAMRSFAGMSNLEVWYTRLEAGELGARLAHAGETKAARELERAVLKGRTKDRMRALVKLTREVDGRRRLISDPPLLVPIDELVEDAKDRATLEAAVGTLLQAYGSSLQHDRLQLLESFQYLDLARKVVGVGSVGTHAWTVLMQGRDDDDPLFLQVKQAQASVLEPYLGASEFDNHGRRVVEGQRLLQASSDVLLGWYRSDRFDGEPRDLYVRQLWDWKTSANFETMSPRGLLLFGEACGWTLARGHARAGDRIALAAYLGKGDAFDRALARFGEAYADLNERDHAALREAAASGRISAQEGI